MTATWSLAKLALGPGVGVLAVVVEIAESHTPYLFN
jgi:hypothetical protein